MRDILFPNAMKPIRPVVNFDCLISYLTIISIFVRISSITFIFLLIYYSGTYEALLKQTILNTVSININTEALLNKSNKTSNDQGAVSIRALAKNVKVDEITSVNNHDSNYTSNDSGEDKNLCEETTIRVNMDELNEKIKNGEIFSDNRSSKASNSQNVYNLII